jgi:hypothetical protein
MTSCGRYYTHRDTSHHNHEMAAAPAMPEFTDTLADTAWQAANNTHLDKLLLASLPPANLLAGQHTTVASHAHCIDDGQTLWPVSSFFPLCA